MVPRAATPESAKEGASWEHTRRMTYGEEGHGRGEQNVPTTVQSADAYDDRAMLPRYWLVFDSRRVLGHRRGPRRAVMSMADVDRVLYIQQWIHKKAPRLGEVG